SFAICTKWQHSFLSRRLPGKRAGADIIESTSHKNPQLSKSTLLSPATVKMQNSNSHKPAQEPHPIAGFALLLFAVPLSQSSPWAALWTTPCILIASIVITWGAESAQFFVAQGFALAILAWMQTLPEFAVEAVLAWKQQTTLLIANLTGALRLLTGLAWPVIYATAATVYRR